MIQPTGIDDGAIRSQRQAVELRYGQVWDQSEFEQDFEVVPLLKPLFLVRRRDDGAKGILSFHPTAKFFFHWSPLPHVPPPPGLVERFANREKGSNVTSK